MKRLAGFCGVVAVLLVLSACSSNTIPEQQQPQSTDDVLTAAQLEFSPDIDPETTRFLGAEDGREFYFGSVPATDSACLIVVERDSSVFTSCSAGFPITLGIGQFEVILWQYSPAEGPEGFHRLGDHLWILGD